MNIFEQADYDAWLRIKKILDEASRPVTQAESIFYNTRRKKYGDDWVAPKPGRCPFQIDKE